MNKLKYTNICGIFKQQLNETMNREETIDTKWKMLKGAIKTVTDIVIGK